jgi:multicomponent Na+:H+ antiporter subunit F
MIYQILLSGLTLCCFMCLYRVFKGPTAPDRAVAVDILGVLVVGFCVLWTLDSPRGFLMDIALAWTLQSNVAVLALAKYLEGKHLDE